jgi:stage II sporulation protein B
MKVSQAYGAKPDKNSKERIMMTKARITYRFDHNRTTDENRKVAAPIHEDKVIPLYREEFKVVEDKEEVLRGEAITEDQLEFTKAESLFEAHSLHAYTTDFNNWSHPVETESDRVERIIKETRAVNDDHQRANQQPLEPRSSRIISQQESDQWSTWTQQASYPEPQMGARYSSRSTGSHWLRITASIVGAVVTGVAFGFFVLSMFTDNEGNKETALKENIPIVSPGAAQDKLTVTTAQGTVGSNTVAAAGVTNVSIAAKNYSFLQNGVFSTQQSADTAQAELRKKGLAAATELQDKITVFVGFAPSRDEALAISQQLKNQNLEIFIKDISIPAVTGVRWGGSKPEAVGNYISEGDRLVQMLGGLTIVRLNESSPKALEAASMQSIRLIHQGVTTLSASVNEGAGAEVKPILQKMNNALNSAVQSMEEYQKNPSAAMLWQAQSASMQYIISQKELIKTIAQ